MESQLIKILCIDDEDMIRQNLYDYLEDFGYKVMEACDGVEGVTKFRLFNPDIVIVDLRMPNMDGFQFISSIRTFNTEVPIIVISGTGLIQDVIDALRLGAWDYLTKPIEDMAIVEYSIKKALEKRQLIIENNNYKSNLEKIVELRTKALNDSNILLNNEIIYRNKAEEALKKLNEDLENRVKERTIELENSLDNLQKTKNKLIQSEKLASLGVLVSGVAHEINTPLGVAVTATSFLSDTVISYLELYNSNDLKKSDLDKFINTTIESTKIILKNLSRAAERVNSFKKLAVDQTSGERRLFNVLDYFNDIFESLHPKLKHTKHAIYIDCPSNLEIDSFPGAYSQIFTNLIFNSLIHGFDGVESGIIDINVQLDNEIIIIIYKDNGVGIIAEHLTKIFDPFFTTKRSSGGTGLGMNIVYNLITRTLHGSIDCKSEPGNGIEFIIQIPKNL